MLGGARQTRGTPGRKIKCLAAVDDASHEAIALVPEHANGGDHLDTRAPRGLDKALVTQLTTGQWLREGLNLLIVGPTGVGKTWIACALASLDFLSAVSKPRCPLNHDFRQAPEEYYRDKIKERGKFQILNQ